MQGRAEFDIIGRVGKFTQLKGCLKISVASDYPRKDERDAWQSNTHWNSLTIFSEKICRWASDSLLPGDLIAARGRVGENSYEKAGKTVYTVDLIATQIDKLASKEQLSQVKDDEAA